MPGIGETLTERAGPLPIWAWAGMGTAALGVGLLARKKKQAAADQAAANDNSVNSNLGTVPISNLTVGAEPMPIQMGDTFVNDTTNVTGVQGPPGGPGKPGPPGPPGKPPAGPAPHPHIPTPAKRPAAKPNYYTVKSGDTLSGIAMHEYGANNENLWRNIYNANHALIGTNPNLIRPGQKLVIPPLSSLQHA